MTFMTPFEKRQLDEARRKEHKVKNDQPNKPYKWADEVLRESKLSPRSPYPSPTYAWYMDESTKRSQGLLNELDGNEIRQAMRGVKNTWYKLVNEKPDLFKPFANNKEKQEDWEKIKQN